MDSTQDKLLDEFTAIADEEVRDADQAAARIASLAEYLADAIAKAEEPVNQTASSSSRSKSSSGGSTFSTLLKNGFGVAPLIGGLISLFGGGGEEELPELPKYELPAALDIETAAADGGLSAVDYSQSGAPRTYGTSTATPASGGNFSIDTQPGESATQRITVNVQAMDARSFLDRSADIAAAVRNAMLNLNSINDVVSEL